MEITTLCAVVAFLRVIPNRSHFFQYESVALSCEQQGSLSEWTVKRNTSKQLNDDCPPSLKGRNESNCFINHLYDSDSGVYWCESAAGRCSNTVNITVAVGELILETPVLPVNEGEAVTLLCRSRTTSYSNLTQFYKDGSFIRSSPTGNLTIKRVSKSDEGLYKCNISGAGDSPESWLAVRDAAPPETQTSSFNLILLPVVGVCLLLVFLMLLCLWRNLKGKLERAISYTDVTIREEVNPPRTTGECITTEPPVESIQYHSSRQESSAERGRHGSEDHSLPSLDNISGSRFVSSATHIVKDSPHPGQHAFNLLLQVT
ncbi:low affinity immunoglobulin gamma Fc region receptor III-A-like [Leuresthes tenuis]|uniref:low affinity immunoglobulin gamma Fc region receptor III-A-like n=1 Tax=Leuresthes tenuis TaxID=355514 RepID=UPI003B5054E5